MCMNANGGKKYYMSKKWSSIAIVFAHPVQFWILIVSRSSRRLWEIC